LPGLDRKQAIGGRGREKLVVLETRTLCHDSSSTAKIRKTARRGGPCGGRLLQYRQGRACAVCASAAACATRQTRPSSAGTLGADRNKDKRSMEHEIAAARRGRVAFFLVFLVMVAAMIGVGFFFSP